MKRRRVLGVLLVVFLTITALFAQGNYEPGKDLVVLYTNDVHCGVSEDLGYEGLVAVKNAELQKTPYVVLVDAGDAIQGEEMGSVSKGEYPVEIMNKAGYAFGAIGNHEFDYGMDRLSQLIDMADIQYLACNIAYTGTKPNPLAKVKPYAIETYGDKKVAFIGVSTPESIAKSTPTYFQEDGKFVFNFSGADPEQFYAVVQKNVDEVRSQGVDYVILLAHLGIDESSAPFRSIDLIQHTSGIDVVLDGHSHSVIPCDVYKNKDGGNVLLSSTGTKLNNIGKLVITSGGDITTSLIGEYPDKDPEMAAFVKEIKGKYEAALSQVIGFTDVDLNIAGANGLRLVRNRETNLGDLCADAYRKVANADIAFVNGGGIRAKISAGDITYGSLIKVHPYGNTLTMVEAKGSEILDALELGSRATQIKAEDGEKSLGEVGGFLQVSGLKYTIDTSVPSSVKLDGNGMFVGVEGARRVKDVMVLNGDAWEPIDPEKTYKLASHNYLIKDAGDGYTMFKDNKLLINEGMLDYQVLITYVVDSLGGKVGDAYKDPQGRITVI
ncbi:MAG: bifunctional metallophosphatase/5'-nucleotidase [Sphaerochaeta sp.]|jgi:2',3'-cyclic-nucleotide 2'-phosphodiesterase (5'-nucleotidase family)|nr:bifunctional metallophosphatase/5'-nucleotidase [Sphaerochaeta sp.]MCH3919674.1 bifunctional metallophosphatase/5'-nucleotidase [Sphaerochaeta sp.]MCI2045495.1 bifunctional metallophosphatase/5'-nucleotidase [Sphaerochaeta sp.]MCI2076696.1 bifunctional metallophosphatase/5'-nucleotidase [Sphaerochaeta sp.]MCI2096514.1 bifunctional metallophosphatase/5'-nucleotidase [Sphaerochaeta sp.]